MDKTILKALEKYLAAAKASGESAGYSGLMSDGGQSRMEGLAAAYRAGLEGKVPDFLEPYVKEVRRETDPEYATFQRLKKKFEP